MGDKLVSRLNATVPPDTVLTKTNLVSLRRIDALKADLRRAEGQRIESATVTKTWLLIATRAPAGTGTVHFGSKFSPEFTHQVPKMTKHSRSVTYVCGAHVTRMPLDQYNVRSGLVGCAEHRDRFD
jgi:hypothetical protein